MRVLRKVITFLTLSVAMLVTGADAHVIEPRRLALVIGNGAYEPPLSPLANPVRDARLVGEALKAMGFDAVRIVIDADTRTLRKEIQDFSLVANAADLAVVYYAGHGVQLGDQSFMFPINAAAGTDLDIVFSAVTMNDVLEATPLAERRLVFFDACRDNPLQDKLLSQIVSRTGTLHGWRRSRTVHVFSTSDGSVASDGVAGGHSPFAESVSRRLPIAENVHDLFVGVQRDMRHAQTPRLVDNVGEQVSLKRAPTVQQGGTFDACSDGIGRVKEILAHGRKAEASGRLEIARIREFTISPRERLGLEGQAVARLLEVMQTNSRRSYELLDGLSKLVSAELESAAILEPATTRETRQAQCVRTLQAANTCRRMIDNYDYYEACYSRIYSDGRAVGSR